jgi:hypothetical protein
MDATSVPVRAGRAPRSVAARELILAVATDGPRAGRGYGLTAVGTESCQIRHVGVAQSGRLHVAHEDGD